MSEKKSKLEEKLLSGPNSSELKKVLDDTSPPPRGTINVIRKSGISFAIEKPPEKKPPKTVTDLIKDCFAFLDPEWKGWDIKPQKVIRAFNVIKVLYIFMLIPYHITSVANTVDNNPSYASYSLPYPTPIHGLEYMMGLLFISGWLSHSTTRPGATIVDILKKKLLRLLPAYFIGAIPVTLLCIIYEGGSGILNGAGGATGVTIEFLLEFFTIGSWNPALMFWTRNRPLWFISTLLTYHYCSSTYLPWIRARSTNTVLYLIIGYNVVRIGIGYTALWILTYAYPQSYRDFPRILHLWSVTQIFLPFIGATLAEYATRIGKLSWSRNAIWRATDAITVLTICLAFFVPCPPVWTDDFASSRAGYYFGSGVSYLNIFVWPTMLVGIYLYSHDQSTLTWVYNQYPKLFDDGLSMSYPLYLTHWPILLLLQDSKAYVRDDSVSVIMIYAVCLCTSSFLDTYIISPLEERIVAYFDPPKPKTPAAGASGAAKPKMRPSEAIRLSMRVHKLEGDIEERNGLISQLDDRILLLEEQLSAYMDEKKVVMKQSFAGYDPVDADDKDDESVILMGPRHTNQW